MQSVRDALQHALALITPVMFRLVSLSSYGDCEPSSSSMNLPFLRTSLNEISRITEDNTPLPPVQPSEAEDEALFVDEPCVLGPVRCDYGYNVRLGPNVFINANCTFVDTTPITLGSRTIVGPNVGFYSGTHPLDPALRNGARGPELGKEIVIGEDCWIGGHAVILPGVTLGTGVVIGAGSVVTRVLILT
jgi:acetyltransferase-like isoleucine patch superfamily enzyme